MEPSVQITKSAPSIFFSMGHWARIRCSICSGDHPRANSRWRCVASEQATQMVASTSVWALVSYRSGITTTASGRISARQTAICSSQRARMRGWRICSSCLRAAGSPKMRLASSFRSRRPSGPIIPSPKSLRTSSSAGCPGSTIWRASKSVSITGTPCELSNCSAADLPIPIPPVSPRTVMGRLSGSDARRGRNDDLYSPSSCR